MKTIKKKPNEIWVYAINGRFSCWFSNNNNIGYVKLCQIGYDDGQVQTNHSSHIIHIDIVCSFVRLPI